MPPPPPPAAVAAPSNGATANVLNNKGQIASKPCTLGGDANAASPLRSFWSNPARGSRHGTSLKACSSTKRLCKSEIGRCQYFRFFGFGCIRRTPEYWAPLNRGKSTTPQRSFPVRLLATTNKAIVVRDTDSYPPDKTASVLPASAKVPDFAVLHVHHALARRCLKQNCANEEAGGVCCTGVRLTVACAHAHNLVRLAYICREGSVIEAHSAARGVLEFLTRPNCYEAHKLISFSTNPTPC